MGGKGGGSDTSDTVYVVLERGVAMDLLNALYIALGITPSDEKKGGKDKGGVGGKSKEKDAGKVQGGKVSLGVKPGGGGGKSDLGSKSGGGKSSLGGKSGGGKGR